MKKQKLTLDDLQVESFVTSLDSNEQMAEGGTTASCVVYSIIVSVITIATALVCAPQGTNAAACPYPVSDAGCLTTRNPNATPCPYIQNQ